MTSPSRSPTPTRAEEEQELSAVLASPAIARSTNLVRLLTFICQKYFDGKADEIKETAIAIQALGRRAEDFDSQVDPIVRVTARTLRKRLGDYYRREGAAHSVQLDLPTGQYVPRFARRESSPGPSPAGAGEPASPSPTSNDATKVAISRPRPILLLGAGSVLLLAGFAIGWWWGARAAVTRSCPPCAGGIWGSPIWSDEFDGASGAAPDARRWAFDVGNNSGWGNGELEVYCAPGSSHPPPCEASHPNAFLDGEGNLVVTAVRTASGTWTSARLKTQGLAEFRFGRIETRMRLPQGTGLWSSFWMLGSDVREVGWPACGSISLMENVPLRPTTNGLGPHMVRSTIHGPGYFGGNGIWQNYTLPSGGRVDDEYHLYGVIWSPQMLQFYVDDPENVFFVRMAGDLPEGGHWVFDHPFFVLISLAVGGQWPGPPDESTSSPARLLVDYVRVYRASTVPGPRMSAKRLALRVGETGTSTVRLSSASGTPRVALSCSGAPENATCTLNPPVVDFSTTGDQTTTLRLATAPRGAGHPEAAPGDYRLRVTAITVSGDTSSVEVPVALAAH
jgi:beta-glucanase (GH16 family)